MTIPATAYTIGIVTAGLALVTGEWRWLLVSLTAYLLVRGWA